MKYVSHEDVRSLLEAVSLLHSDITAATLPERTIAAVNRIVSAEMSAFDSFGSNNEGGVSWLSPVDAVSPQELEVFGHHIGEHPLLEPILINKRTEALSVMDFLTASQFKKTGLYNEFYRKIGINKTMVVGFQTSPGQTMTSSFYRKGNDFSDNEKLALTLLAPHLANAIRNSFAFEQLNSVVEAQASGVITLDENGKQQFISDLAQMLLKEYFADDKVKKDSLPRSLQRWIESQNAAEGNGFDLPATPLKIANVGGELNVRLIRNNRTKEKTLLLEEKRRLSPKLLESFNLTKREAEVLFWITRGKTDAEIGELLFISPRTVHKHSERIYVKLGVETRTAAMSRALEILH